MKKISASVLIILAVVVSSAGCNKLVKAIFPGIDAKVPEIVVTIPFLPIPAGIPVPDTELPFPSYTQHINLDSTIKAATNGAFGIGDVSSVKIKEIDFKLINGDSLNNFSNFKSARATLTSDSNTDTAAIASMEFPDVYSLSSTYQAPANTPELVSYIKGSELTYVVYGTLRKFTTKEIKMAVNVTMAVK